MRKSVMSPTTAGLLLILVIAWLFGLVLSW